MQLLHAIALSLQMATSDSVARLTAAQVTTDLTYFRDVYAARERAYTPATRARMLDFINRQIQQAKPMTRAQLALVFAEAQAFTGNLHSQDQVFGEEGVFHVVPIAFWWFTEGAIVTRAHPDYRRFIGARITAIGGVPPEEAMRRVQRFIAGTSQHLRYVGPSWLRRLEVLQVLGLGDSTGAAFDFILTSGERTHAVLPATPTPDPAAQSAPWREAVVPGRGNPPWPSATDGLSALPPYLRAPTDLSYELLAGGRVLYTRSNVVRELVDSLPIPDKTYSMFDSVLKGSRWPKHVIVDLRFNEGGNFFTVRDLADGLIALGRPDGRIYVIVGRSTASAAIILAAWLKAGGAGRTRIVGETMNDREQFWSEGGELRTPASRIYLRYTNGYHDWANGCNDRARCYWPATLYGVRAGSLAPNIPVAHSFADYVAGRDPDLDAVMRDLSKRDASVRSALGARR